MICVSHDFILVSNRKLTRQYFVSGRMQASRAALAGGCELLCPVARQHGARALRARQSAAHATTRQTRLFWDPNVSALPDSLTVDHTF